MQYTYRNAITEDIYGILVLQEKYHVSKISTQDKPDGFVTTMITEEQFTRLIEDENGVALALDGDKVIGYALAASWQFWSEWPFFRHMIKDLPNVQYKGQQADMENSYQYGPICIDKPYRNGEVLYHLFELSRETMAPRFPILLTFINQINGRSKKAHVDKLGLDIIETFDYNDNHYFELGYDTRVKTKIPTEYQ